MKLFEIYNTYNYELSYIKAYNKEHAYQLLRSGLYDSAQKHQLEHIDIEMELQYFNSFDEMIKANVNDLLDELISEHKSTKLVELSTKEYESITDNYYCSGYESVESDLVSGFDYRYSYRDEVIATHDPVAEQGAVI